MKQLVRLKDIATYSKGLQINGDELVDRAEFDYLNGGINPSGKWNEANCVANTITISEGGNSCGYVNFMTKPFWCGAHCYYLHNTIDNSRYLYYALKSQQERIMKLRSGACMPNIKKRDLGNFEFIFDYDVKEQEKVTLVLSKLENVIEARKQELLALDNLIKARFVEMFGDPVLNPLGWDVKPVIDICDCMVPGRDKPKSFTGAIPWITIDDLIVNSTTFRSKQGLGLTEAEISEVKRKTIPVGSVMMSCVGNLGICSIAGNEMIINQQLHSFQCHSEINNVFLMYYLGQRKDYMEKQASSTTVLYMNKSICNSIPVIIPDLELQEQFASFVRATDKSKIVAETEHHTAL